MHGHSHSPINAPHSFPGGPILTRRAALGGMGAALSLARFRPARAGVLFPQRLVILNVLGGLDGLSAVVPYGDPMLASLRPALVPPAVSQPGGMLDLGGFYGLNPALPNLYSLYQSGQMLAVHAVGGILASRSHFADQGALQAGELGTASSGWMNRLASLLPTVQGGVEAGMVLGSAMPPIAQGPANASGLPLIGSWVHNGAAPTPNTLAALVETLGAPDPLIGGPIQSGFNERQQLQAWLAGNKGQTASPLQAAMQAAGVFISASGGPAVALVETTNSVDTHTSQVARLQPLLSDIDTSIGVLAAACGSTWANTVVMTITEFGRTAYMNGCAGTDHGTAFAMFLAGGAVAGGQVISQWPGLNNLYQGRDLAPTTDIRSIIMGVLQDHLQLTPDQLATVFPGASGVSPMGGLVGNAQVRATRYRG